MHHLQGEWEGPAALDSDSTPTSSLPHRGLLCSVMHHESALPWADGKGRAVVHEVAQERHAPARSR